jgi:hypothetical protein
MFYEPYSATVRRARIDIIDGMPVAKHASTRSLGGSTPKQLDAPKFKVLIFREVSLVLFACLWPVRLRVVALW